MEWEGGSRKEKEEPAANALTSGGKYMYAGGAGSQDAFVRIQRSLLSRPG